MGPTPSPLPPGTRSSSQCLLDLDPDLAELVDPRVRQAARAAAIVTTLETDGGWLPLPDWLTQAAPGPGVLILDGVLAAEVGVSGRVAAELLGAGDLIQPLGHDLDELLRCEVCWRALMPSKFAVLDQRFDRRVRFWPQVQQALLRRAARRVASLNVQRTIAAQPRLEQRLALLLWHLASRWGKVERGGIRLPVPLTHHLLGQLIGAERPSVTHALTRLSQAEVITGHGDEWHLHGRLEDQLSRLRAPARGRQDRSVTVTGTLGAG